MSVSRTHGKKSNVCTKALAVHEPARGAGRRWDLVKVGNGRAAAGPPAAALVQGHEVSRGYLQLSLALPQVTKG